jgi:hypothetical protein
MAKLAFLKKKRRIKKEAWSTIQISVLNPTSQPFIGKSFRFQKYGTILDTTADVAVHCLLSAYDQLRMETIMIG